MQDNVELYHENNSKQKRDSLNVLNEYSNKINWNVSDNVADVGSGDGTVTTTILKKFIPATYVKLLGFDISENMVKFANEHYSDEKTSFLVLDIEDELPETLRGSFDHVFSFYALHWITQQQRAFFNINQMLREGGECLLLILGYSQWSDIFRKLYQQSKWHALLKHVKHIMSPYQDLPVPQKIEVTRTLMSDAGFTNITVEYKELSFVYNTVTECRNAIAAVNPFRLSAGLLKDFLDDCIDLVREIDMIYEVDNNGTNEIHAKVYYGALVAHGRK